MCAPPGNVAKNNVITIECGHIQIRIIPIPIHHGLTMSINKFTKPVKQVFVRQAVHLPQGALNSALQLRVYKLVNKHMTKHIIFRIQ